MADIQVVIPSYNYGRYLKACVNSVLSQQGVEVSVIIVDDASTDDTPQICAELCRDARVSVIRHSANKGHIATYNDGLAAVSATYVVLLSADDLLAPGCLLRSTALMEANPSVGLVYGHPVTFRGDAPPAPRTSRPRWKIWSGLDWVDHMCRSGQNFIYCPEVVMRTAVQHRIGDYRAELPHSGDMEMWLRAAAVADIGRISGADQAFYRLHPQSMQHTVYSGLLRDLYGRHAAFESALTRPPVHLAGAPHLLEKARRALALAALRHVLQAFRCGREPDQASEDFCEFALETFPGIVESGEWKALASGMKPSANRVLSTLELVRVDLWNRVQWRMWRRSGIAFLS